MTKKKDTIDLEKSLKTLEKIVDDMETGELSLEKSLAAFEKGIKLTKDCQIALSQAEQRVNILIEQHGEESLEPFESDE
ncbi:MAG: exodeoxyribonuclease VII small subunit [Moraxellaceae bacterium]|nr:MAG: exodeoxyribonuclease VII small subunit [Moraxellaceae bacterium]